MSEHSVMSLTQLLLSASGKSFRGMDQSSSGDSGISSSVRGLNQSALVVILERLAFLVSSGSDFIWLKTSKMEVVVMQKPQNPAYSFCFDQYLLEVEEEEDLDRHLLEEMKDLDRPDFFFET
uniref:Uncharacterized protein n=1 Tax=Tanacetum cinerariifolium TaxID=118510 RepID=A0A6L2NGU9_TANCI|nr:hypothetical protein [Tanacetum cinerariifolium]